jgi:DNA-directed RNA polymerase specialized sigma24 family protein
VARLVPSSIAVEVRGRSCRPVRIAEAYQAHEDELRWFAFGRMRDSVGADDIVQESFLRLARESGHRRYPRQPNGWLCRVAANLITSAARRALVARRYSVGLAFADKANETPERDFLARERCGRLDAAMQAAASDETVAAVTVGRSRPGVTNDRYLSARRAV